MNDNLNSTLDSIDKNIDKNPFDQKQHDSTSRLEVTKLILKWYFGLIAGSFLFVPVYNLIIGLLNHHLLNQNPISYIEVSPTVSMVTNALNGIIGFVIGYYFKNKED